MFIYRYYKVNSKITQTHLCNYRHLSIFLLTTVYTDKCLLYDNIKKFQFFTFSQEIINNCFATDILIENYGITRATNTVLDTSLEVACSQKKLVT